jgi:hypothetical protein
LAATVTICTEPEVTAVARTAVAGPPPGDAP